MYKKIYHFEIYSDCLDIKLQCAYVRTYPTRKQIRDSQRTLTACVTNSLYICNKGRFIPCVHVSWTWS